MIQHLSVFDVIVAGDLGDRGPCLDKVVGGPDASAAPVHDVWERRKAVTLSAVRSQSSSAWSRRIKSTLSRGIIF